MGGGWDVCLCGCLCVGMWPADSPSWVYLKLCDHWDMQWASSMQTRDTGGKAEGAVETRRWKEGLQSFSGEMNSTRRRPLPRSRTILGIGREDEEGSVQKSEQGLG